MKLPKINIGISDKRNYFDMSHDVSTTCDFGFVQPTIIQSLIPNSSIDVKTSSFLRLAPMPCPTFGRVKVQTDNVFVPTRDVQLNIDSMLAGTSYRTPWFAGTCTQSDYIQANKLFWSLIQHNEVTPSWDEMNEDIAKLIFVDGSKDLFNQIFRFSFSTNEDLTTGTPKEWHDLQVDYESFGLSNTSRRNYLNFIKFLLGDSSDFYFSLKSGQSDLLQALNVYMYNTNVRGKFWTDESFSYFLHSFIRPVETLPFYDRYKESEMNFDPRLQNVIVAYNNMSSAFRKFFDSPITSDNADFSFQWCPSYIPKINGFDQNDFSVSFVEQDSSHHDDTLIYWRLNIQLTPFGRKLFKIFNACHFNFRQNDYKIELNKLYAYYKAWFDKYNPGRTTNWEYTHAYKLIHSYYDYPNALDDVYFRDSESTTLQLNYQKLWHDFLFDLTMCNFYLDTDNITVATRLPAQYVNNGTSVASSFAGMTPFVDNTGTSVVSGVNVQPSGNSISGPFFSSLDALSVKLLTRLYNFVNRESVLGSNIAEILRTKYGIDVHESLVLGSDSFYCQISDIMGTVNNDETALGEYAGKGVGSGDSSVHFETKDFGYFIQLVTVIPLGGYVQASEHPLIEREDYYTPDFDSLGFEPLPISEVLGRESILNNFGNDKTFGFRPRFFNLKTKNNLNNGGFAFRSQRGSFLPYCLDRIFSEGDYNDFSTTRPSSQYGTVTYGNYSVNPPIDLYPTEELRSIGLYETFGNYDRIFYDVSGGSDNFILHQVHDFAYHAPMKPIQDSFDTFNDEVNNDVTKTEHE